MVRNGTLAKRINDAAWDEFRHWLDYFGRIYGKVTVPVPPQYASQECSRLRRKGHLGALSEPTHHPR